MNTPNHEEVLIHNSEVFRFRSELFANESFPSFLQFLIVLLIKENKDNNREYNVLIKKLSKYKPGIVSVGEKNPNLPHIVNQISDANWVFAVNLVDWTINVHLFLSNILLTVGSFVEKNLSFNQQNKCSLDLDAIRAKEFFRIFISTLCHELCHFASTDFLDYKTAQTISEYWNNISQILWEQEILTDSSTWAYRTWVSVNIWDYKYFKDFNEGITDIMWKYLFDKLKEDWIILEWLWEYNIFYENEVDKVINIHDTLIKNHWFTEEEVFEKMKKAYFLWGKYLSDFISQSFYK